MAFTRSAPSNADEESFPCSSTHDSHDDGAIGDSCDVRAGRSLQAASDAASASSSLSLTSGRLPQASSAQQPMHHLLHLQCWGAGFAGGSGVVRSCMRVCVSVCSSQLVESMCSEAVCSKGLDSCLWSHLAACVARHLPSRQAVHLHLNSCNQLFCVCTAGTSLACITSV